MSSTNYLRQSTRTVVCNRVLELATQADNVAVRLTDPKDSEALHDFRVALRRLRTWLRAYRPYYPPAPQQEKLLRNLANVTNTTREAEVALGNIRQSPVRLTPRQRIGSQWLVDRLETEKDAAYQHILALAPQQWQKISKKLHKHFGSLPKKDKTPAFASANAQLLEEYLTRLQQRIAQIHSIQDQEAAHQARISGKHLRYLLEPLKGTLDTKPAIKALTKLQDLLGELHDMDQLAERLLQGLEETATGQARQYGEQLLNNSDTGAYRQAPEAAGLLTLLKWVKQQREQLFATLRQNYLNKPPETLCNEVQKVIEHLR